jgi:hypothetical protein
MLPRWHASTFLSIIAMEAPMTTLNKKQFLFRDPKAIIDLNRLKDVHEDFPLLDDF